MSRNPTEQPSSREGVNIEALREASEVRKNLMIETLGNIKTKEDISRFPPSTLLRVLVRDTRYSDNEMFGVFDTMDNVRLEKLVGLRHLLPQEYQSVSVRTKDGRDLHGQRHEDGSFYSENGEYIPIWNGDRFVAKKEPFSSPSPAAVSSVSPERAVETTGSLSEVSVNETLLVGDSRTVGYQRFLQGAKTLSRSGWTTAKILDAIRRCPPNFFQGIKTAAVFVGVNDLASDVPVPTIVRRLQTIVDELRNRGVQRIVVINQPPWDRRRETLVRSFNEALRTLQNVDSVADLYEEVRVNHAYRMDDRIHFNDYGPLASYIASRAGIKRKTA